MQNVKRVIFKLVSNLIISIISAALVKEYVFKIQILSAESTNVYSRV